ncbi:MAG: M43 family zinc metalloprotease [Bacteroidia bacterium]|jgi:PKD repeat protein|nr:M43 family zinc metalloprotease [Bacteroidia bacterium]
MTRHFLLKTGLCMAVWLGSGQFNLHAQLNCGSTEAHRHMQEQDPDYLQRKAAYDAYVQQYMQQQNAINSNPAVQSATSVQYVIPVVFHIVHEYGSENITDAQILDQVAILNEDFQKLNADTSVVIPPFKPLIGNASIEFRLARLDPDGNCTNGIDRIYSHETRVGNDLSKLNPWPRNRYLNIWVVRQMRNGVAGYAYYPSAVQNGFGYYYDGIIILHDYIGSIGTGAPGTSRALTHEIGHYLNLAHPWGDTNNPGVACGDDGIPDTPLTEGWTNCPTPTAPFYLQWANCTDSVPENVQNFMDYSYCSRMFTIDQVTAMHAALNSSVSDRDNLWSPANLALTGVDGSITTPCAPIADFNNTIWCACEGTSITYTDQSWNGPVTSRNWNFGGGTPATATTASAMVTYNQAGSYSTSLDVTNATGNSSITKLNNVYISPAWSDYTGTWSEDFENANFNMWITSNPGNNPSQWQITNSAGFSGTHSLKLNSFGSDGAVRDDAISPSIDLSLTSQMMLNFKYTAAVSSLQDSVMDQLRIFYSVNCGRSWVQLRVIGGYPLIPGGLDQNSYSPLMQNQWTNVSISLPNAVAQQRVRFRFEYTAGNFANNIYIDDINITGVVGQEEVVNHDFNVFAMPNPSSGITTVSFVLADASRLNISLTDATGRRIDLAANENFGAGQQQLQIDPHSLGLSNGIYILTIDNGSSRTTQKLVFMSL